MVLIVQLLSYTAGQSMFIGKTFFKCENIVQMQGDY